MHISRLTLKDFTSFKAADFEFAPGVNVLIGENATGKSHVLKLLYALSESARRRVSGEGLGGRPDESLNDIAAEMIRGVFLPDELNRLVRRVPRGRKTATAALSWTNGATLTLELTTQGRLDVSMSGDLAALGDAVFIPTREVLSIYPGFTAAWLKRESAFDRTYYDLCVRLGLRPLRGPRPATRKALSEPLERVLRAKVHLEDRGFYLRYDDGGDIEAQLAAEGHRKLGMIAYLVANGSLSERSFLFWDEPEAGINPRLVTATGEVIFGLANAGLQSFLATHDYLFASDLSLRADPSSTRFFALARGADGVVVERGERFSDLESNPILEALMDLHDRERRAFILQGSEPT